MISRTFVTRSKNTLRLLQIWKYVSKPVFCLFVFRGFFFFCLLFSLDNTYWIYISVLNLFRTAMHKIVIVHSVIFRNPQKIQYP